MLSSIPNLMLGFFAAFALPVPWIILNAVGFHGLSPTLIALATGIGILGAAFVLSWGAEVLEMDVSQALALAVLALIAVLPEYAVSAVFAFEAGRDPELARSGFAIANVTGSNRLLLGLGWSSVVLFAWFRHRAHAVALERSQALEMGVLLLASIYALTIPFKGELNILDTGLVVLYAIYAWATSRAPAEEPHLAGPAEQIGGLPTGTRRMALAGMFGFAAYVIFIAAEPFAHSLVETGEVMGVDKFLLVQWLAPIASEAPEFIVALLFVARRRAAAGMRTLVSSQVNQWTLLVATLAIVYSIGAGTLSGLPLGERQDVEIWLTAAMSFFGVVLIADFQLGRKEALWLLCPFLLQLILPMEMGSVEVRPLFALGYAAAGFLLLLDPRRRSAISQWPRFIRESVQARPPHEVAVPATADEQSVVP